MKDGHGGVTIGSEISGGVRNVFAENCRMERVHLTVSPVIFGIRNSGFVTTAVFRFPNPESRIPIPES
jgi:polygalacturonase